MKNNISETLIREATSTSRSKKEHIIAFLVTGDTESFQMQLFYGEISPSTPRVDELVKVSNGQGVTAKGVVTRVTTDISLEDNIHYVIYVIEVDAS